MVDLAIPESGYRNYISADGRYWPIRRWLVTNAAAHPARAWPVCSTLATRPRRLGRHRLLLRLPLQEE